MVSSTGSATMEPPGDTGSGAGAPGAVGPSVAELDGCIGGLASFVADPACFSGPDAVAHQPEAAGCPTPVHWLADRTGESPGQAADVLKPGEAITEDGPMAGACRDGRLSVPGARLLADATAVNPAAEEDVVEAAPTSTHRQL